MIAEAAGPAPALLWWGRSDPAYARNLILRHCLEALGWQVVDFRPRSSPTARLEARRIRTRVDAVWVPCFRQRDALGAAAWARSRGLPLLMDPFISAYDKLGSHRDVQRLAQQNAHRRS